MAATTSGCFTLMFYNTIKLIIGISYILMQEITIYNTHNRRAMCNKRYRLRTRALQLEWQCESQYTQTNFRVTDYSPNYSEVWHKCQLRTFNGYIKTTF